MGGFSIWHWIIVLAIVLVLFGRGRVADVMGEFGKGLKSFKQGIADEDADHKTKAASPPAQITAPPPVSVPSDAQPVSEPIKPDQA